MTLAQLPGFAFRSAGDYASEMDKLHLRYDPVLGQGVVDTLERLGMFQVFTSVWFSAGLAVLVVSIVACTLDRTPRLWRQSADIRVVQPAPFYDPKLPDRALLAGVPADAVAPILRRHRFRVREAEVDGVRYLYGDRHRWTKLATLFTHLGLILFLLAAAVTSQLGDEQGLVVAEGESLTVQPIGTPGLLLVKNLGFEAPGFESGMPSDFTTDLAVYSEGREIARKTIRVNDPLAIGGYTFHQNGFGPAPEFVIRDADQRPLWSGPIPMIDQAAGFPYTEFAVPGSDVRLTLLLQQREDGVGIVLIVPFRVTGEDAEGRPVVDELPPAAIARGEVARLADGEVSVELRGFADFTLLIAKNDPGVGIVWTAFASLIVGLLITFWLPRRRVWARLDPDGRLALVGRSDRYVDFVGEFGRLVDDLVASRRTGPSVSR